MARNLLVCCFAALLGLTLCWRAPAWSLDKPDKTQAYQIRQKSFELGVLTIIVNDAGLKVTNEDRGYFIVSQAPKWDVTIVRPRAKVFAVMPLERWCTPTTIYFLLAAGAWDGSWLDRPSTACTLCAVPAHKYTCPYPKPVRTPRDLLMDEEMVHVERRKILTTLTVLDLKVPEPAGKILERIVGTPHAVGAPGAFDTKYLDGRVEPRLTTLSCTTVPLPADAFAAPGDFKLVSARDVTLSSGERDQFENLESDMGLGKLFGKEKGPK